MKRFIIEQSEEKFYTSHSGLALVGLAMNRFTSRHRHLKRQPPRMTVSTMQMSSGVTAGYLPRLRATSSQSNNIEQTTFSVNHLVLHRFPPKAPCASGWTIIQSSFFPLFLGIN